jgi:hypothetical protein
VRGFTLLTPQSSFSCLSIQSSLSGNVPLSNASNNQSALLRF